MNSQSLNPNPKSRAWTPERKAEQSKRMKETLERQRAARSAATPAVPATPAVSVSTGRRVAVSMSTGRKLPIGDSTAPGVVVVRGRRIVQAPPTISEGKRAVIYTVPA